MVRPLQHPQKTEMNLLRQGIHLKNKTFVLKHKHSPSAALGHVQYKHRKRFQR